MGVLIPSKIGLVLTAPTSGQKLADAVTSAATVEPPFAQRKVKYRRAPGIGAATIYHVDPDFVAREMSMSTPPAVAVEIDIFGAVIRVLLNADHRSAEARFMCIQLPGAGSSYVIGFPWAEALAQRTEDFLKQANIPSMIEVIKSRG